MCIRDRSNPGKDYPTHEWNDLTLEEQAKARAAREPDFLADKRKIAALEARLESLEAKKSKADGQAPANAGDSMNQRSNRI